MNEAREVFNNAVRQRTIVEVQISKLKKAGQKPIVSEHAILRFLERVRGIDMKSIEEEILSHVGKSLPGGKVTMSVDEYKIVAKDNVVVTIT